MTPEEQADNLKWQFSEFENLDTAEVKKACDMTVNKIIEEVDTLRKVYWREVKARINRMIL